MNVMFDPVVSPPPLGTTLIVRTKGGVPLVSPWFDGCVAWSYVPDLPESVRLRESRPNGHVKYLLCPGTVRSRTDGQIHQVGAKQLVLLYGVSRQECRIRPDPVPRDWVEPVELIRLEPRYNGDYTLPEGNTRET